MSQLNLILCCLLIFSLFSYPKHLIHSQELIICCEECNYLDLDCLYKCDMCDQKVPDVQKSEEGLINKLFDFSQSLATWLQSSIRNLLEITRRPPNHTSTTTPKSENFLPSFNDYLNSLKSPSESIIERHGYELNFERLYRSFIQKKDTDRTDFEFQKHLLLEKEKVRKNIPNLKPCCGDCLQNDIQCLSNCQKFDCEDLETCIAAGHGAYSNFCQKKCLGQRNLGEIHYVPSFICSNVCTTVVMEQCITDACRSYGCEVKECLNEADKICHIT